MRLSHRAALPAELGACFRRFGEPYAYPEELHAHIPALWRRWAAAGQMMTQLIEDQAHLGNPEPVGFGAAVFIAEPFAVQLRTEPPRLARAELVRRSLADEPVVLDPAAVPQVNRTTGLSLFFLNDALTDRSLSEDALHLVHERWSEALYELRAFHLRELFWEIHDPKIQRWSEGCGLILRRAWEPTHLPGATPSNPVFLVGLNREEVKARPGTHGSYLFAHVPPRFGFTARQQELLRHALEGLTDTSLASALHLSLAAIKKRWVGIYEQVSAHAPGWLEDDRLPVHSEKRGAEKRRRLLHYLRQHPEELHPANAAG